MPFVAIDCPIPAPSSAYVTEVRNEWGQNIFASDAIHSSLSELRIAGVSYPLQKPVQSRYIPVAGEFLVEGFSPQFIGRGATYNEAKRDWLISVHSACQDLMTKRPFEMSANDLQKWKVISSRIDVPTYRNQTPIQTHQFGRVRWDVRPYPSKIHWESGEIESISLDQVNCPDFVTYKPNQPVEAVVERDPLSFRLIRIVSIERRPEPSRLSKKDEAMLLDSIGSSSTLPKTDW